MVQRATFEANADDRDLAPNACRQVGTLNFRMFSNIDIGLRAGLFCWQCLFGETDFRCCMISVFVGTSSLAI